MADRDAERSARRALDADLAQARARTDDAVAARERDGAELRSAAERAEVEAALRVRAEAEVERLRAELAARPAADELRALISSALVGRADAT